MLNLEDLDTKLRQAREELSSLMERL